MRRPLLCVALAAVLAAVATPAPAATLPAGYYDDAAGKSGGQLRSALHNVIDAHSTLSYSAAADALVVIDRDPANANNILLAYTGASVAKTQFPGGSANREHLWPNSLGIDNALPAYSDLFNLRPCDATVNSDRANKYFDNGGGTYGSASLGIKTDADSWEPPTWQKGDIARAMFYMDVRYEGDSGEPNLILTDSTNLISSTAAYMGKLSALLAWHTLDPVSDAERTRNDRVHDYQGNRNPFVDNPTWVASVYNVPEPGAVALLSVALVGAARRRRVTRV